ncbi:hypothetical protein QR680_014439 [Steinernema hermaphroditum]|uniref:4Fe-4S ferredoxin-type domain-containing protein n=1 Tax=Steinernema hermaphroditum TaxID=289476 RepID=A0AA39IAI0_9BILA|nr:hypothetical protein QR680_014439 [Steinernema hermaphroditum]
MTRLLLGALFLFGVFTTGLSLYCDTCHDKCSCLSARQEPCPPGTFCYTVTNMYGQIIRKGCAEACDDFAGDCKRCSSDFCNRSVRGPYLPSGYEDCENYNVDAGSYDKHHIGWGGSSGVGQGVNYGGGSGIGHGAGPSYGGSSGIGQGAGYGGHGIGQGAGYDPYNQERYGQQGVGIGDGVGYNQPRPGIGQGVYPYSGSAASVVGSLFAFVVAFYVLI